MMSGQYLHVSCKDFSLLVDTAQVEEVSAFNEDDSNAVWRGEVLPLLDLSALLLGEAAHKNRDCLILKYTQGDAVSYFAAAVGGVSSIENIAEGEFSAIPQLAFPYNDYFDKAYIHPQTSQCIYRLRSDALFHHLEGVNHDD